MPAELNVKITSLGANDVTAGDRVVFEQGYPITMLPRDFLPTCLYRDREHSACVRTDELMAAWITPNAKSIELFLQKAKQRAPGQKFSGMQTATIPQVKAVYDELKARNSPT